jgi:hypothetical protein
LKKAIDFLTGLSAAIWSCFVCALFSVYLAFLGAERAAAFMSAPLMLIAVAVLAAVVCGSGLRALKRGRFSSAALHLGCACVMAGWLWGQQAARTATPGEPANGSMALIDGDVTDALWDGPALTNFVGRVPFTIKLEKFIIEHYEQNSVDRDAGRMAPIREYRSRVTVSEPGKTPYVANIMVNRPLRVRGYNIYQMSWGNSVDRFRQPVVYTVLQFIRDPGVPLVYAGFALLSAGVLLFTIGVFRSGKPEAGEGRA